ncbi:divergent polysaccharide deacetylase family protein [Candidatus Aerophobetes bacterium]|nr:divergent polysaccharide deacetylase family protein [Candidatus Aerophobetes bacterium]
MAGKKRKKRARKLKLLYIITVSLFLIIAGLGSFLYFKSLYYERKFSELDLKVERGISSLGLSIVSKKIKKVGPFPGYSQAEETVKVPFDYPLDGFKMRIRNAFPRSVQIQRIEEKNLKDAYQVFVRLGFDRMTTHILKFFLKKIKIALLIDDFGYTQGEVTDLFLRDLDVPLTISIIPGTPYAGLIAQQAYKRKKEVMLHLPMEPKGKFKNEYKWIIMSGMGKEEIENVTRKAYESIPHCAGVNNHMGSLATSREEVMRPVLEVVKEKNLYFVDSKTTSSSVAFPLARKLGIRCTSRDVFLDNEKSYSYIKKQFQRLVLVARKKGRALGIAHASPTTARAIRKIICDLDKRKISLVYVSDIVE